MSSRPSAPGSRWLEPLALALAALAVAVIADLVLAEFGRRRRPSTMRLACWRSSESNREHAVRLVEQ